MENQNPDRAEYVRRYLERPGFHLSGTDIRVFSAMGDSAGAAVLASLDPARLGEKFFLQKVLAAACVWLEHPEAAESHADRVPSATRVLLLSLMADAGSDEQRSRIRAAMDSLERATQ